MNNFKVGEVYQIDSDTYVMIINAEVKSGLIEALEIRGDYRGEICHWSIGNLKPTGKLIKPEVRTFTRGDYLVETNMEYIIMMTSKTDKTITGVIVGDLYDLPISNMLGIVFTSEITNYRFL